MHVHTINTEDLHTVYKLTFSTVVTNIQFIQILLHNIYKVKMNTRYFIYFIVQVS